MSDLEKNPRNFIIKWNSIISEQGPDYVCKSCHRLIYKQSMASLNVHKYAKVSPELLSNAFNPKFLYSSYDGKEWICNTCHAALSSGNMPTQAIANGLRIAQYTT